MSNHRRARYGTRGLVLGSAAVVLLGGLAVVGYRTAAADGDCQAAPVGITVAPAIEEPVREAARKLRRAGDDCAVLTVVTAAPDTVVRGTEAPELWLPDSSAWVSQTTGNLPKPTVLSASTATTPVVLASTRQSEQPDSWLEAMRGGEVVLTDPARTATGTAALLALQAERGTTKASDLDVGAVMVPAAQRFGGEKKPLMGDMEVFTAITATGSSATVPVTEQAFVHHVVMHEGMAVFASTPKTGAPVLDFPLVTFRGSDERVSAAGRALVRQLASPAGQESLRKASLRDTESRELPDGSGVGKIPLLAEKDYSRDAAQVLREWSALTLPSHLLAVVDVSGSMKAPAGDRTRIQLLVDAASTGIQLFPDRAALGVWAFSDDHLTNGGEPYREVLATRELRAQVSGVSQRDRIASMLRTLPGMTGGGTALNDTVLASFRQATRDYKPGAVNMVLLITDGTEDGSSKASEAETIAALQREFDPARPVRLVCVGISDEANLQALQRLAAPVHGAAYLAQEPGDISSVFIKAFLTR